jgi:hypothetical protein
VAQYLTGADGRLMRSLKSLLGSALLLEKTEVNGQRHQLPGHHRHLPERDRGAGTRNETGAAARRAWCWGGPCISWTTTRHATRWPSRCCCKPPMLRACANVSFQHGADCRRV